MGVGGYRHPLGSQGDTWECLRKIGIHHILRTHMELACGRFYPLGCMGLKVAVAVDRVGKVAAAVAP